MAQGNGFTALHWAARRGLDTTVELLLATPGVDPNALTDVRWERRHWQAVDGAPAWEVMACSPTPLLPYSATTHAVAGRSVCASVRSAQPQDVRRHPPPGGCPRHALSGRCCARVPHRQLSKVRSELNGCLGHPTVGCLDIPVTDVLSSWLRSLVFGCFL